VLPVAWGGLSVHTCILACAYFYASLRWTKINKDIYIIVKTFCFNVSGNAGKGDAGTYSTLLFAHDPFSQMPD
jgi:hypothetical protein